MPLALSAEAVRHAGLAAGLTSVGVCSADAFPDVAATLHDRKAAGLHGGMQFTYRNPERSTTPRRIDADAQSLVVGAYAYASWAAVGTEDAAVAAAAEGSARIAAYAWADHYAELRNGLAAVADLLVDGGHSARVVADDNALVDRAAAVRAGIGWWGKNTNVLLPGKGSCFVLGAVVTSAALQPDEAVDPACGGCTRCLSGCPTGAIIAPGVLDARKCLAWLLQLGGMFPIEFRQALGDRIYGCDDCQEVCPPNRESPVRLRGDEVRNVAFHWLLQATDEQLLDAHGRWYIPDRNLDYVRRNALIGWTNTTELDAPDVDSTLHRYLSHPNPMLAAHAVWAARMLARDALAHEVVGERSDADDPMINAELRATVAPRAH